MKLCHLMFLTELVMGMLQRVLSPVSKFNKRQNKTLMTMWNAKYYQEKTIKTVELLLNEYL